MNNYSRICYNIYKDYLCFRFPIKIFGKYLNPVRKKVCVRFKGSRTSFQYIFSVFYFWKKRILCYGCEFNIKEKKKFTLI